MESGPGEIRRERSSWGWRLLPLKFLLLPQKLPPWRHMKPSTEAASVDVVEVSVETASRGWRRLPWNEFGLLWKLPWKHITTWMDLASVEAPKKEISTPLLPRKLPVLWKLPQKSTGASMESEFVVKASILVSRSLHRKTSDSAVDSPTWT